MVAQILSRAAAFVVLLTISGAASAQTYPSRQINIIVPYASGGTLDLVARLVADGLKQKYGHPAVVLNRPGGNGNIGTAEAVRADPDGYTLYLNNDGGLAIHAVVDPNFKFDPVADFVPISYPAEYCHLLMINKDIPVKTVQEFFAHAKASPGKLSYGSPATGSLGHLATEMFAKHAGIQMTHIPYRGAAPALNDLLAGVLAVNIQSIPSARGQFDSDRIKILATFSDKRVQELPEVPTMTESGYPGFVIKSWLGVFGPRGLPDGIRDQVSRDIGELVNKPEVQKQLRSVGFEPVGMQAAEFAKFYGGELKRWQSIAEETGLKRAH
jgi:tripartite-type tricarboxylate transporter receptor subunit TctC